jgi:hypothetical protein
MQTSEDMGEVSSSSGSPKDKLMIFPENYDTVHNNNNGNDGQHTETQDENGLSESTTSTSTHAPGLQPLVPIAGSQVKDYPKCFVHIQPCYPFGMANVDEKMLVITPDDDLSLYEDAVVCIIICCCAHND